MTDKKPAPWVAKVEAKPLGGAPAPVVGWGPTGAANEQPAAVSSSAPASVSPAATAGPAATAVPGVGRQRRLPLAAVWVALGAVVIAASAAVVIVLGDSSDQAAHAPETPWGAPTPAQDDGVANPVPELPTVDGGEATADEQPGSEETARPAERTEPTGAGTPTGDLGLGVPMTAPACDGSWVVFLGAATDPATYAADVRVLLDSRSGARYTLTQGGCSSMRQQLPDGTLIYAVWTGPYPDQAAACAARGQIGGNAYVKRMDDVTPPEQLWEC